jgi:hypothetical protein
MRLCIRCQPAEKNPRTEEASESRHKLMRNAAQKQQEAAAKARLTNGRAANRVGLCS